MKIDLDGKVALVTAAGSGIGRACAQAYAAAGAIVVATDRELVAAEETVDRATRGLLRALSLDVTNEAAVVGTITDVMSNEGRIDILHNHAGIQIAGSVDDVTAQSLDYSYSVNLRAAFDLSKRALPALRATKGTILNTASNAGVFVDRGMVAYNTTKAALIAMTKQMALDLGCEGIRVNALCPGWVDTPFNAPYERQLGGRDALHAIIANKVPLRRFGTVEEIAAVAAFLVSPLAAYLTGQAIVVDGGEAVAAPSF